MSAPGWGKLSYESWEHEKVEAVGNRAWGAFLRAVAWSGYKRKDGWISTAAMSKIERDARVWGRLEAQGLLESRDDGGAMLHDWSVHNETNARRTERVEAYILRGKLGAAAKHKAGSKQTPSTTEGKPEVGRSRSRSRSEIEDQDPDLSLPREPSEDPPSPEAGAYPGNVTQLSLVPPSTAPTPTPKAKPAPKPKPPKPPPLKSAPASSEHGALVDHYFATFERARGEPPKAFGSREGLSARKLLGLLGLEAAKLKISGAFEGFRGDQITINDIAREPDRYKSAKPAEGTTEAPRKLRTPEEIAELQRLGRYPKHPPRPPETLEELKARNAEEAEESRRRAAIVPASAGAIQEAIRFGIFDEDDERERLASEGRGT